jgi:hypothetical protein
MAVGAASARDACPDAAIPAPVRLTICGLERSLSMTNNDPGLLPVTPGVNETLTVQDCPAPRLTPQLFVCV